MLVTSEKKALCLLKWRFGLSPWLKDGHPEQDTTRRRPEAVGADWDGPGDRLSGGVVPVLL